MLARAVMTALLDKYLLQERTHVRTVSPAGQHLWAAVNVPSALWEHLQPPLRLPATSAPKDTRMRMQTQLQSALCSMPQLHAT